MIPSGRTAWARHFDLGVNYTARMNRTGHTLVECSELPPENARLIAPDGKMTVRLAFLFTHHHLTFIMAHILLLLLSFSHLQTTSIMSPLLHGVTLYNFCQKQTDECTFPNSLFIYLLPFIY